MLTPDNTITIYRGATKSLGLFVSAADGKTAVDLTGARIVFTVKKELSDPIPLFQKTSEVPQQVTIVSAKKGLARIFILPQDTRKLEIRQYIYDIWVKLASGDEYPIVVPSVLDVQPAVTTML